MKKRIVSAVIMIAILVPLIIIGGLAFKIATGVIAILAYREILNLKGIKNYPVIVTVFGLISILVLTITNESIAYNVIGLDYKRIGLVFLLMFIPTIIYYGKDKYSVKDAFSLTTFISFIGITLNLLSNILL